MAGPAEIGRRLQGGAHTVQAKFINPILSAMVDVLSTMAQVEPTPGRPQVKGDDRARGVVSAVIGIEGERTRGSLAISFPEPVIRDIVRRMLGEEMTVVDDTARDLTGEISNMVLGSAKAAYAEAGYDFGLTQPRVFSGENHVIDHGVDGPRILLPFATEAGEFFVEICFRE